jgi:hypothetical protein
MPIVVVVARGAGRLGGAGQLGRRGPYGSLLGSPVRRREETLIADLDLGSVCPARRLIDRTCSGSSPPRPGTAAARA